VHEALVDDGRRTSILHDVTRFFRDLLGECLFAHPSDAPTTLYSLCMTPTSAAGYEAR